ncbi:PAS domain S-box protein [Pedobacter foliorum]|uniref:sensor histidine kinase n=1 Tax=Pedobacter foliorum TaxID=2739058 RepID=UPI00156799F1|nr:HAMP domain-containing sensor histidine kinase [Pedobacter foliorum]NRF37636.1 PAS domain S-box protein [Pedobacter foliorum]
MKINEHPQIENHVTQPSDIFLSAFKYSGIGIALIGLDGSWIDLNNTVCQITGYTRAELLKMTFQEITYPDDLLQDLDYLQQLLAGEIDTYTMEKRYVTKVRRVIWISLTVSLVKENNKPSFFISQIIDVDNKKKLSQMLDVKVSELELTKQTLDGKIRQMEELNYTLTHNLRGPLKNLQLIAHALLSKIDPSVPPNEIADVISELEGLQMLSKSSAKLADDLDQLMKLTSTKQNPTLDFRQCDIEQMTGEVLQQLSATIYEKQAALTMSFDVPYLSAPPVYLKSILYNLVSNALKYTSTLTLPEISISTFETGTCKTLSIKDNGIGIDLNRHGNQLFQLNQTFHTGYDSTGIGLFLTKAQVEAIGGRLCVESEPDKGSTFAILFSD